MKSNSGKTQHMYTGESHLQEQVQGNLILFKAKLFFQLVKFRLSAVVVFSGTFGYLLAQEGPIDWVKFLSLMMGSFLVTSGANTINQIKEKEFDKLMKRTKDRPLPTERLSIQEATIFTLIVTTIGAVLLMVYVNPFTALLTLLSLILYGFVYTPLKRVSPISVFVGAFPGAMPPLIGWVAYTGTLSAEAFIIFGIQFMWQFPHFWSIAWLGDEDYKRAGFKMLPNGKKDFNTAFKMMTYTLFLIPMGVLPAQYGITGLTSALVAVVCGALFLVQTFSLMRTGSRKSALKLMFSSFFYLPIVQLAFLLDKI
ncbi:heme o synthase [Chondrinema litorale]|uniref:heme o synthase n=1 Tax=Chondrinema litorale TaxID=2994555 RepID=UPI003D6DB8A4